MSENFGKIVQVIGPTVDCEFDSDKLPNLLNALKIEDQQEEYRPDRRKSPCISATTSSAAFRWDRPMVWCAA